MGRASRGCFWSFQRNANFTTPSHNRRDRSDRSCDRSGSLLSLGLSLYVRETQRLNLRNKHVLRDDSIYTKLQLIRAFHAFRIRNTWIHMYMCILYIHIYHECVQARERLRVVPCNRASVLHYINAYISTGSLSRTHRWDVAARKGLTIRVAASIYGP